MEHAVYCYMLVVVLYGAHGFLFRLVVVVCGACGMLLHVGSIALWSTWYSVSGW